MTARKLRVVAGKDRTVSLKELIAKSGVPLCGLELIHRSEQKQPKDVITAQELAAIDFTPWEMDHPPGQPGPSGEAMRNLWASARVAAALVERSKSELIALWRDAPTDDESLCELVDTLQEAAEVMKSLANMVQVAHLRLLVAAQIFVDENSAEQTA